MSRKFWDKNRIFRNTAILLSLVLSIVSVVPVAGATSKKQLQKQKSEAESKLNNAKENVAQLQNEKQEAQEEVDEIDQQLVELLATMDILEDEIEAKKVNVAEAQESYEVAKDVEQEQYKSMKSRIKFLYEHGDVMYMEILMQSQSIADAMNKADYVEKVYDYDRDMLEDYQVAKQEASDTYDRLVNEEAELEGLQLEYKEQQAELENSLSEKKAVVENFDEKLAKARTEAKRYENQVKETNKEIARIAAKEQAEREAREKAEREAKEKAAQATAAAQAKAGQTNPEESQAGEDTKDSSSSSTTPESYDEGSQEGEYKKEEPAPEPAPSSGSGLGGQIASYACKFIGNPYVAGGTSLTNGTDCSGFTMSVYAHFGISIPRTSYSQLSYGKAVSYSEAQPGDIMCYAGHVGIYIGNGMIVHASTPATGIKTTVATYRPILSVRRIVK